MRLSETRGRRGLDLLLRHGEQGQVLPKLRRPKSVRKIEKLRRYKKPMCKVQVPDETTHYSSVLFADGAQMAAGTCVSGDLESCFYRLAEKYGPTVPETYDTESMSDKEESF